MLFDHLCDDRLRLALLLAPLARLPVLLCVLLWLNRQVRLDRLRLRLCLCLCLRRRRRAEKVRKERARQLGDDGAQIVLAEDVAQRQPLGRARRARRVRLLSKDSISSFFFFSSRSDQ